jgi:hypothetical protein
MMPDYPGGEEVWLRLRAQRDTAPFTIRLRAALKYLLRACRLRCVEISEVSPFRDGGRLSCPPGAILDAAKANRPRRRNREGPA